jgi:hypothetical protein
LGVAASRTAAGADGVRVEVMDATIAGIIEQ